MPRTQNHSAIPPFLKWAGGKRWLTTSYPNLFQHSFRRYIEPFLGSGAVFFHLLPDRSILSDSNPRLIETYAAIRDKHQAVLRHLKTHHNNHSKDYYYHVRQTRYRTDCTRAAQFIYLNRTCWNGLYRVNRKGEFNVPIGTKTSVLTENDDFALVANILKSATIIATDFESTIRMAKKGDFIFADPPYTVQHNNNGFVKYNESLFCWDDQVRLRDAIAAAVERGAMAIVTNADHASTRRLYRDCGPIIRSHRHSVIAGSNAHRSPCTEVVIKCGFE
jgi:DNA adenine methylase